MPTRKDSAGPLVAWMWIALAVASAVAISFIAGTVAANYRHTAVVAAPRHAPLMQAQVPAPAAEAPDRRDGLASAKQSDIDDCNGYARSNKSGAAPDAASGVVLYGLDQANQADAGAAQAYRDCMR